MERYSHDEAEWAPYGTPAAPSSGRPTPSEVRDGRALVRRARRAGRAARRRAPACPAAPTPSTAAWCSSLRADERGPARSTRSSGSPSSSPGVVNDDLRAAVRRARPLVPAGPGQLALVDDRRQRRHQRRRAVLRQVRRHPRLRARPGGRHRHRRARSGSAAAPPRASPATTWPGCSSAPRAPSGWSPRSPCGCARPRPAEHTVVGYFASLVAAGEAVAAVARRGLMPVGAGAARPALPARGRRLEEPRASRPTARRCCWPGSTRPGAAGDAEADAVAGLLRGGRARPGPRGRPTTDEADALFAARRLAYPALERLGPGAHRGRLRAPVGRCRRCSPAIEAIGDAARRAASPTSRTPATATCTR